VSDTRKQVDEALIDKERLLDLTNDAIIVRDPSDRIIFWNKGAAQTYGYNREEAIGRVSHDLFQTEFPEPLERIREEFVRNGQWGGELRHTCANGSTITVSTRWVAERDRSGKIVSILESNRDMTEVKLAQETQNRLAAIVESSDDAIVSKNLDGTITSWNRAAEQMFGYAASEAIGQHITLIVPPDRLVEGTDILARLQRGERVDHFETVRRRKDGTLFEVSATISPVKDAAGRVIGASKVARDITQRKRLEQLLHDSELSGRLLQLQDEERRRVPYTLIIFPPRKELDLFLRYTFSRYVFRAAETDMIRASSDLTFTSGSDHITGTILIGAEKGPPAMYFFLLGWLGRIKGCGGALRIAGNTTRGCQLCVVIRTIPVAGPLPDVSGHVI
jgi:PAS domain S-box-containing protein